MEVIDDRVRKLGEPSSVASEAVVSDARLGLERLIEKSGHPKRRVLTYWTVAGSVGIAAAMAALLMLPNSATSNAPATNSATPVYVAKSGLGVLMMQAAAATKPPVKLTGFWYQKIHQELYYFDDGTKYGAHKATPDVSVNEFWHGQDGSFAYVDAEGKIVKQSSDPTLTTSWETSMGLPTDLDALRTDLYNNANNSISHLQGNTARLDKHSYADYLVVSSITEYLSQPLKPESQMNLYVLLAQLADSGAIQNRGNQVDRLGRRGISFSATWTGDPKAGSAWTNYVVEPSSGKLLETQQYIQGVPDTWKTYDTSAFVDGLGLRPFIQ